MNIKYTAAAEIKDLWDDLDIQRATRKQQFDDCIDTAQHRKGSFSTIRGGYVIRFPDLSAIMITPCKCEVLA